MGAEGVVKRGGVGKGGKGSGGGVEKIEEEEVGGMGEGEEGRNGLGERVDLASSTSSFFPFWSVGLDIRLNWLGLGEYRTRGVFSWVQDKGQNGWALVSLTSTIGWDME